MIDETECQIIKYCGNHGIVQVTRNIGMKNMGQYFGQNHQQLWYNQPKTNHTQTVCI